MVFFKCFPQCPAFLFKSKFSFTSISVIFVVNVSVVKCHSCHAARHDSSEPGTEPTWQLTKLQFASFLNIWWYHHSANHFLHSGFNLSVMKNYLNYTNEDLRDVPLQNWWGQKSKDGFSKTSRKKIFTQHLLKDNSCQHSVNSLRQSWEARTLD